MPTRPVKPSNGKQTRQQKSRLQQSGWSVPTPAPHPRRCLQKSSSSGEHESGWVQRGGRAAPRRDSQASFLLSSPFPGLDRIPLVILKEISSVKYFGSHCPWTNECNGILIFVVSFPTGWGLSRRWFWWGWAETEAQRVNGKLMNSVMFTFCRQNNSTFLIYQVPEIVHFRLLVLPNFTENERMWCRRTEITESRWFLGKGWNPAETPYSNYGFCSDTGREPPRLSTHVESFSMGILSIAIKLFTFSPQ